MPNLNIHHLLPKLDELRTSMACENGPDVLGICETLVVMVGTMAQFFLSLKRT